MLDAIYNAKILEYAANISRVGRLDTPQASVKKHSKLCGSTVLVDLKTKMVEGELIIEDFAHEVNACALGQASSAIMAQSVIGSSHKEIKSLQEQMNVMLKENGSPPNGRFEACKYLEPVRDYKARHASTMLTFDAVLACMDEIAAH